MNFQFALPIVNLENMDVQVSRILEHHLSIYRTHIPAEARLKNAFSFWLDVYFICKKAEKKDVNVIFNLPTTPNREELTSNQVDAVLFLNVNLGLTFCEKILGLIDAKTKESSKS